jgi:hypothetical protein
MPGSLPAFHGYHSDYVDEATLADVDISDDDEVNNLNLQLV